MNKVFLVAGGDLRFVTLAERLAEQYTVYAAGFDRNAAMFSRIKLIKSLGELKVKADYAVLPLPASPDGVTVNTPCSDTPLLLEDVAAAVKQGGTVFGGLLSPEVRQLFDKKGISTEDYSKREEFAVLNAVATAEGAIQAAMEELAVTLSGRKILILGAGRIAKVLIKQLSGFGTEITVAARKFSDLAWAEIYGCGAVHINEIDDLLGRFDIIFNTVPAVILDENRLKKLGGDCLVIDLASKPGGVDFDTASCLGIRTMWLLSLPGKTAPVTSGEIIAETVKNILSERRAQNDGA
ncbi:MAG: dipicolinate synthase subunit DpsA [Oscillospiraceae bacterium]|nr:dipicolinate synthase subunit DpsA [Oscillospiraceae bacterium]